MNFFFCFVGVRVDGRLRLEAHSVRTGSKRERKRKKYCVTYGAGSAAWSQTGTNWLCSSWRRSSGAGLSPSNYTHTHRETSRVLAACWAPQVDLMSHTSSLCPSISRVDGPANCSTCWYKHHVRETKLCRRRAKNKECVGENIWNSMLARRHSCNANKCVYTSPLCMSLCTFMGPPTCIYAKPSMHLCVCFCKEVCVRCVCACSLLGPGQWPGSGIIFSQQEISHWCAPCCFLLQASGPREHSTNTLL